MATYTQLLYHIVFSTKNREKTIEADHKKELFQYAWGFLKNKNCHLYRMNGVEDHVHILTHMPTTICISELVRDIKVSTSLWIKAQPFMNDFKGWQDGYGAFTCSFKDKDVLIEYIKNQEMHHKKLSFEDEYRALLIENGIEFDEKYLL